jgi:uncharacterized protein (TIGR02246 family)
MPTMNRVTRTALPALVALVAACATTTRVDRTSEEQRIRELGQQAMRAAQSKDVATYASFYADDAVSMGANQRSIRGRDAIRGMIAEMFAMPNLAFSFAPTRIEVAESGDIAHEIGTYRFAADMPGGRLDDEGKYITLWKKVAGEWKIASDMSNSDRPIERLAAVMVPRMQEAAGAIATPEPMKGVGAHFHARELVWRDAPASLPRGAKIAVLEGDPMQPGPFTFRLKVPAGYRIPPHTHPVIEHVTVVSGALSIGRGEQWDDSKLVRLDVGDFMHVPPGTAHFAMATGETVVQLHSTGPWGITYLNPQDDPRK